MLIVIRYSRDTEPDGSDMQTKTVEVRDDDIEQFAESDGADYFRSKQLLTLAHAHVPKGWDLDELGDFDERARELEVWCSPSYA